jgi:hypothetical protein
MRKLFEPEIKAIMNNMIQRVNHDFRPRHDLKAEFSEYSSFVQQQTKLQKQIERTKKQQSPKTSSILDNFPLLPTPKSNALKKMSSDTKEDTQAIVNRPNSTSTRRQSIMKYDPNNINATKTFFSPKNINNNIKSNVKTKLHKKLLYQPYKYPSSIYQNPMDILKDDNYDNED